MKRLFCLLLAFILLPMVPTGTVKASETVTILSVTPDKNIAYMYEDITYTVATSGTTTGDTRYQYFIYVNGKDQSFNGMFASQVSNLSTTVFKVHCYMAGDYKLGCAVVQKGVRYPQMVGMERGAPDKVSPVTKVAYELNGGIVFPDRTSAKTGESLAWTSTAYDGFAPLKYNWNILCDGNPVMACSGLKTTKTVTCQLEQPGAYDAVVWVYDDGGTVKYAKSAVSVPVAQGLSIKSVQANQEIAKTGENLRWTILEPVGGKGFNSCQFSFDVYRDNALIHKNPWNKSVNLNWKADKPGNYKAVAYVTDGTEQGAKSSPVTRVADPMAIVSVKANRTSAPVGAEIIWTTATSGGIDPEYCFDLFRDGQPIADTNFSYSNAFTWKTAASGSYRVTGTAFDAFGDLLTKDSAAVAVSASSKLAVKSIHADRTKAAVGEKITWTAVAMGGSGSKSYKFEVYKNDVKLPLPAAFATSAQYGYTPTAPGKYKAAVYVKDATGSTTSPVYSEETSVQALVPLSAGLPHALPVFVSLPPQSAAFRLPEMVAVRPLPEPTDALRTAAPKVTTRPPAKTVTPRPAPTGPTPGYPLPTATSSILTPAPLTPEPVTQAPYIATQAPSIVTPPPYPVVIMVTGMISFFATPTPGID